MNNADRYLNNTNIAQTKQSIGVDSSIDGLKKKALHSDFYERIKFYILINFALY